MFALISFLIVSYLVVVGFVLMVLAAMQEAARDRPEVDARWKVGEWSRVKFAAAAALIALPSLIVLLPIGLLFIY